MRQIPMILVTALLLSACSRVPVTHKKHGLFDSPVFTAAESDDPSCRPLGAKEREALLAQADPGMFPGARYRKGGANIEKATDCSRFVHEIYRRAGLPYAFRSTHDLREAPEFDLVPEEEAQAGDLMLFRGHVGIVNHDGQIISATRVRSQRQPSSITTMDRSNFRSFRGRRPVLRYRCVPEPAITPTSVKESSGHSRPQLESALEAPTED